MLQDTFTRMENATDVFIDLVMESGFTNAEATKIYNVYLKAKAIKLHVNIGRYTVAHGAFWNKNVMQRALEL